MRRAGLLALCLLTVSCFPVGDDIPPGLRTLPAWNDGAAREAFVDFARAVTNDGPDYVPREDRVAVFDNDGTLWAEQPMYVQLAFTADRIRAMAPEHPEWRNQQPFKAVLEGDLAKAAQGGTPALLQLLMATHSGMTTTQFEETVEAWIDTARHPQTGKLYTEMAYQPMLEILDYLRALGFKTYIVSGGGVEFIRPWAMRVYGIPKQQVIGSSIKLRYVENDGNLVLERMPEVDFIDDKEGKPVGIQKFIGVRPLAAFGNSDGDLEMLRWTMAGPGKRLAMIIHHTDAEREWAYDRDSPVGRLDRALDEAEAKGWAIVDMKKDWKVMWALPDQPFAQ